MNKYRVIVGNIGTVYDGNSEAVACSVFSEYVGKSNALYGRASGEAVTMMDNSTIVLHHNGERDVEIA